MRRPPWSRRFQRARDIRRSKRAPLTRRRWSNGFLPNSRSDPRFAKEKPADAGFSFMDEPGPGPRSSGSFCKFELDRPHVIRMPDLRIVERGEPKGVFAIEVVELDVELAGRHQLR